MNMPENLGVVFLVAQIVDVGRRKAREIRDFSLPLTKAESIRQTQAITISTDHAAQLIESGAWNPIAR